MLFYLIVGIMVAVVAFAALVDRRRNRVIVPPGLTGRERRNAMRAERASWTRQRSGTAGAWYLGGDGGGLGGHGGFGGGHGGGHGGCGDGGGGGGGDGGGGGC